MTGCLPHDSSNQPPQASYTVAAHHAHTVEGSTETSGQTEDRHHQTSPGQISGAATLSYPAHSRLDVEFIVQQRPYRVESPFQQAVTGPVSADPSCGYRGVQCQGGVEDSEPHVHRPPQPTQSETSPFLHHGLPRPDHAPRMITHSAASPFSAASENPQGQQYQLAHSTQVVYPQQHSVPLPQEAAACRPPPCQSFRAGAPQYHHPPPPPPHHHHHHHHRSPEPQQSYRLATEIPTAQPSLVARPAEGAAAQWQLTGQLCCSAQPPFSGSPPQTAALLPSSGSAGHQHPGPHCAAGGAVKPAPQSALGQAEQPPQAATTAVSQRSYHRPQAEQPPQAATTAVSQQSYHRPLLAGGPPTTMRDEKPSLQVTTGHSPVSPGSTSSSAHFTYPEQQPFSTPGHLASDSGSSPYMSPVKQEANWRMSTPPRSSDMDSPPVLQVHREQHFMQMSGSSEAGDLADSETGSSVLEDNSGSSREQSPFSTMTRNLSLHSPEHPPSPLAARSPQPGMERREDLGEGREGGDDADMASLSPESDFHPSKFKRRLHDRYMLSLKDTSEIPQKIKEESLDSYEKSDAETEADASRKVVPKLERTDSPGYSEIRMPQSLHRSSSDTEMTYTESTEIGATSADEGDVFMEPTVQERTKSKRLSLHQREPLDLSRAHPYCSFRSSSGSSPLPDLEHLSPASKMFSPVFRSPHRLPYSPHGLMSPQSQSPLCSVPEGGRIFSFNVPSPLEGAHSDSDLISPSPVSPRVFTFPPHGSLHGHPMSEVNRLALSPRAPYTPPPSFMRGKPFAAGGALHGAKWGDEPDFYGRRCLSESDMTYLCPMCGHVFASNDSLAKHIAKHLPSETVRSGDTKIHYCKVCNRSFSRSDMLTRHMRLHTGLKPYECFDCGQVFSRSDHLNTHRRTHTGEKPYHCPHCPYSACRRDMITRHMRTHTKRTSRRSRYLSVPDEADTYKPSGSVSSTDRTDSQDFSVSGRTCSVSSVESVDSELIHSSHPPPFPGASVDSLLSPDQDRGPRSSPSSSKMSDEAEGRLEAGSSFDRFMQYRKGRNWSTTSVESVDSEDAVVIREGLVDDAFLDPDVQPTRPAQGDRREGEATKGSLAASSANPADIVGLETQHLQKCFISPQQPGNNSS